MTRAKKDIEMKVVIEKADSKEEEQALIKAFELTGDIKSAAELLEGDSGNLPVTLDGRVYIIKHSTIYYIESVDKKTFVYTKDSCYESKYRLYELETILLGMFLRCSKATILNLKKVRSVNSEMSGRMVATLLNGESIVISRGYVKEVKGRLGI